MVKEIEYGFGIDEGEEARKHREATSKYPKGQVIHDPNQVKSPNELREGGFYRDCNVRSQRPGAVLELLAINSPCEIWIKVRRHVKGSKSRENSISIRDRGIAPYDDGTWNPDNYLVPVEKPDWVVEEKQEEK